MSPRLFILVSLIVFGLSATIPALLVNRFSKALKATSPFTIYGMLIYFITWFIAADYFSASNSLSLVPVLLMGATALAIGYHHPGEARYILCSDFFSLTFRSKVFLLKLRMIE